MGLAVFVGDSLHVHGLDELELVHEAFEWGSPAISNGLEVLALVKVNVNAWHSISSGALFSGGSFNKRLGDHWNRLVLENLFGFHMLDDLSNALVEGHLTGVDVELRCFGLLVGVGDTSEVLDFTSTGLLVKSLNVTLFADFERGTDVALEEVKVGSLVGCLGKITGASVGGNEGNKDDDTSHVEKL